MERFLPLFSNSCCCYDKWLSKMFRETKICKQDWDFHRFLVRELTGPILDARMCRHFSLLPRWWNRSLTEGVPFSLCCCSKLILCWWLSCQLLNYRTGILSLRELSLQTQHRYFTCLACAAQPFSFWRYLYRSYGKRVLVGMNQFLRKFRMNGWNGKVNLHQAICMQSLFQHRKNCIWCISSCIFGCKSSSIWQCCVLEGGVCWCINWDDSSPCQIRV